MSIAILPLPLFFPLLLSLSLLPLTRLIGYMNVALEQTEEFVDGQMRAQYGDTFIRGNNIMYISTQKRKRKV